MPEISIPMVTFRHEAWVGQAIESVLMQEEVDWEIVLGDDASDDATVGVAQSYLDRCMRKGQQRLRILPHETQLGRRHNFRRTLEACTGQFIAQLDGDDFFVSSRALSIRADFLKQNPELSAVFCAWNEIDENGRVIEERRMMEGKTRYMLEEFGPYCPCTSSSVMFRRGLFGEFPAWWLAAPVGDWPLHVLNLLHGEMGYINEVLAVHRTHANGVWTKKSEYQKLQVCLSLQTLFVDDLPKEAAQAMCRSILPFNERRSKECGKQELYEQARALALWCARHQPTKRLRILARNRAAWFKVKSWIAGRR